MAHKQRPDEPERPHAEQADETELDTEGQSFHNYELARAVSRERLNEAARIARDAARAREAREAKRTGR